MSPRGPPCRSVPALRSAQQAHSAHSTGVKPATARGWAYWIGHVSWVARRLRGVRQSARSRSDQEEHVHPRRTPRPRPGGDAHPAPRPCIGHRRRHRRPAADGNGGPGALRSRCRHCAGRTPCAVGGWTTIGQSLASIAADGLRRLRGRGRASAPVPRSANVSPASACEPARGLAPEGDGEGLLQQRPGLPTPLLPVAQIVTAAAVLAPAPQAGAKRLRALECRRAIADARECRLSPGKRT